VASIATSGVIALAAISPVWTVSPRMIFNHTTQSEALQDPLPGAAVKKIWSAGINRRLTLDKAMTSKRFGKIAMNSKLVRDTWSGMLHREKDLPPDWTQANEVLVGMSRSEPPDPGG